jgi:hypothetical protein
MSTTLIASRPYAATVAPSSYPALRVCAAAPVSQAFPRFKRCGRTTSHRGILLSNFELRMFLERSAAGKNLLPIREF